MKIGKYELEKDVECKMVLDGVEIFSEAIERLDISPADFTRADWGMNGSIIVEED